MAISENTFTPEELEAAATANPALIEHAKSVILKKGFVVTPKTEYDALEGKHVGAYTSRIAKEIEDNISTITGIKKKDDNEKWTDYYQRAPKELKSQLDAKNLELETIKKSANIDDAERQRLKTQEELIAKQNKTIEDLNKNHTSEIHKLTIGNQIISDTVPVRETFIKDKKLDKAIEIMHKDTVDWMLTNSEIDKHSSKPIYFEKQLDGTLKAMIDDKGNYKSSAQIYAERMADFIDEGRKISGAGGGEGGRADGLPHNVTNKSELSAYLTSKGLIGGSPEFTKEYNKYASLFKS